MVVTDVKSIIRSDTMNQIFECLDKSCVYRTPEGNCMHGSISLDQEHHCMNCEEIILDNECDK